MSKPIKPRLIQDQSGNSGDLVAGVIQYPCPCCGDLATTPPIASLEVLKEWTAAGVRELIYDQNDADRIMTEGRTLGLAETRTAFDERMAYENPPLRVLATIWITADVRGFNPN